MFALWIALAFAVLFPLFWSGVVWLIAQMGWSRLAARYRTEGPADARWLRFTTGRVGLSSYSGTLHVGVADEGLHLRVPLMFRPGHPPVLIPWDEITEVRPRKLLWHTTYVLRIGTPHAATVTLPERAMALVREGAPGEL